jgi:hypothetical protein
MLTATVRGVVIESHHVHQPHRARSYETGDGGAWLQACRAPEIGSSKWRCRLSECGVNRPQGIERWAAEPGAQ